MAIEVLNDAPASDAFTPLEEHQSHTPTSFFGGKPVLYYHSSRCRLLIAQGENVAAYPLLSGGQTAINGEGSGAASLQDVGVWVTSERLILYSPTAGTGISVPYPTISLHAIQRLEPSATVAEAKGLYLQLSPNESQSNDPDEDMETLELTLIPPTTAPGTAEETAAEAATPIDALFAAVSACADLHPDPSSDDEDEPGPGSGAPGAGGWITGDNMHEYFDEDGQLIGGETLPAVAGTVRSREENGGENGNGQDESKWQRTE